MVSAISAVSPTLVTAITYQPISVAPSATSVNVVQDSVDVMDHYGVAPAYVAAVAYYAPAYAANHNADVVSAVAPVVRSARDNPTGGFIDTLA